MSATAEQLNALGTTAISESSPAGESMRYEPEFETIATEIEKLNSVHKEPVDWDVVVDTGSQLLGERTKDLTVACYLCLGLFERDGYGGMATGLTVIRDLVTHFWDSFYPEPRRARARASALSWLAERLGEAMGRRPPGGGDKEAVATAFALAEELENLLGEKLAGQDYSLLDLYRPLRDAQRDFERKEKQASAGGGGKSAGGASGGGAADLGAVEVQSQADAQKVTKACQAALRTLAGYLRGQKLSDPAPYRLARFAAWMGVDKLPPDNDGETQLPAVPEEKKTALESMLESGDYQGLVNEAEEAVARTPFWLDAHRYSAAGLQMLGEDYAAARHAVVSAVGEFVQRLPGVVELNFQGGTPFADDETRAWLRDEVAAAAQGAGGEAGAREEATEALPAWEEAAKQAKRLRTKRKFKEGLQIFQEGRARAASERERFMWDLAQARYCFDAGYTELALPQLEYLDQQVERFALEEWEPTLSVEVARLLLLCHAKSKGNSQNRAPGGNERLERARVRLCRLDAASALELRKGG